MNSIAGWTFVAQIPNQYEASARIHVDTESMLKPLMKGLAAENNIYGQIRMMRETLISRPNMEKVIRMTDLDLTAETDEDIEGLINALSRDIRIDMQAQNLFKVAYGNTDPQVAKKVVQSLLNLFVESNLGANRKDLAGARRFIDEQVREYEEQLELAERRLSTFKQKNMTFMSGTGGYFDRLQTARRDKEAVEATLGERALHRDELKRQLNDLPPYIATTSNSGPSIGGASRPSELASRISVMERRLDELYAAGYKELHPDVKSLEARLKSLRDRYNEEQSLFSQRLEDGDIEELKGAGGVSPNPIYDQVKVRLIDAEAEIASLKARLALKDNAVKELEALAKRIPEVEAELARLNRDYDVIKNNYNQFLQRRESARIAQDLEIKSDKVQFRIIDPPETPSAPSSPNRLLFVTAVLFMGVGAGAAFAFLLSQLRSTYSTVKKLRDNFSLPVLGSITAIVTEEEKKQYRRRLAVFSIFFAGLFISYGGVIAIEMYHLAAS